MSRRFVSGTAVLLALTLLAAPLHAAAPQPGKINVLVVTGGHPFDANGFETMWNSFYSLQWTSATQATSSEAFTEANLAKVDVVATYDMIGKTTEEQKQAFLAFLRRGGGLVALHHTMAARPDWPAWSHIMGGRFFLAKEEFNGQSFPQSGYQHDVDMDVTVVDPRHPVTRGLSNFRIHDEAYNKFWVAPNVKVLLTTDHPMSDKAIAWSRAEGKARIVFIQLGHDNQAFANPNYRKLVEQAVLWTAHREAK